MKGVRVERVILVGVDANWDGKKAVEIKQGNRAWKAKMVVTAAGGDGRARVAVVRDPKVGIAKDWTISFA